MFRMCIACSIIETMTKDLKIAHSTLLGHSALFTQSDVCVSCAIIIRDHIIRKYV